MARLVIRGGRQQHSECFQSNRLLDHFIKLPRLTFYSKGSIYPLVSKDSLKKAVRLIRNSGVDRWSWWEIQSQEVNSREWPEHVGYFGLRGGKLAKASYERCVELFKRARSES